MTLGSHCIIEFGRLVIDRLHNHRLVHVSTWHATHLLLIHVSLVTVRTLCITQLICAMLMMGLTALLPAFLAASLQVLMAMMIRGEEAL